MRTRRGITILEVACSLVVTIALVVGILLVTHAHRRESRRTEDGEKLRGIGQSLVVWCNGNAGEYPVPSRIDTGNTTVPEIGLAKNTTANIFSIMIFNGNFSPEMCVSASERNRSIVVDSDYSYEKPGAAVVPESALWDPGFSADFTNGRVGNFSYAALQLSAGRRPMWSDTFSTTETVLANRGPETTGVAINGDPKVRDSYVPGIVDPLSNAILTHGRRGEWKGNVCYNDGHVAFESNQVTFTPYKAAAGPRLDALYFDEPDDVDQSNMYLGIFTKAGERPSEFEGIWD